MPPSLHNPYRPVEILRAEQVERVHEASMHILETMGIDFLDAESMRLWDHAGARVDHKRQRVWIDRGLLHELLAKAPSSFAWRARNPAHDLQIGGSSINFGPCGGMVFTSDLERGRQNGSLATMQDLYRLGQLCNVLHFASWEQVAPMEINPSLRHLYRVLSAFTLTDKPLMEAAHGRVIPADCIKMAQIVFGGLPDEPVLGDIVNVNSPLRYDERMLGGLITLARAGQVVVVTPFILAGAMSPITMASALAQQNAEALAGVALTQIVRAGTPVVYGGFTISTHMKSGAPSFGTPEAANAAFASTQMARRYNLPYRGNGGLTTANTVDTQAAQEATWHVWPAVLAHSNMVMHSAGWLEGGLTASFEKFVLDCEALGQVARFLNTNTTTDSDSSRFGVEQNSVWDADLSVLELCESSNVRRAHQVFKQLLCQYQPPPLDVAICQELQEFVERRVRELQGVNLYEYE